MSRRADRIISQHRYGGILVVPGRLNDHHYSWFLVDTGSVMTTISQRVADRIGLDISQATRRLKIISAHQLDDVPLISLDSLQVGSQRVDNIEVAVMTLPPDIRVDGLLGVNFLRRFRVTFEFDQATLILRPIKDNLS